MSSTGVRQRVAVVIYQDASVDLAHAYKGLLTALEFQEAGDDVTLVYDGSGVDTLAAASSSDHKLHPLVEQLRPITDGACDFCARAHGVREPIERAGWPLLGSYKGHASIRRLVAEGYQVLSF